MNKYEYHIADTLKHKAAIMNCLASLFENYTKSEYSFINIINELVQNKGKAIKIEDHPGSIIEDIAKNTAGLLNQEIPQYDPENSSIEEDIEMINNIHRSIASIFAIHDASKLEDDDEFNGYSEVVYTLKGLEYGTPEHKEAIKELDAAFEQYHVPANPHHPEYHHMDLRNMNIVMFMEMICDWCAAAICRGFVFKFSSIDSKKKELDLDDFTMQVIKENVKLILKPEQYDENK